MFDQKKVMEELEEIKKSLETSPENYSEMQGLGDVVRAVNVNAALIAGVVGPMQTYTSNMAGVMKNIDLCVEEIKHLHEHISELYKIIYELAPDYEIIETMAETDEERRAMCDAYMNHGEWSNAADDTEHEKRDQS